MLKRGWGMCALGGCRVVAGAPCTAKESLVALVRWLLPSHHLYSRRVCHVRNLMRVRASNHTLLVHGSGAPPNSVPTVEAVAGRAHWPSILISAPAQLARRAESAHSRIPVDSSRSAPLRSGWGKRAGLHLDTCGIATGDEGAPWSSKSFGL